MKKIQPNKLVAIVAYLLILFILSSFIIIGAGKVISSIKGLDYDILYKSFTMEINELLKLDEMYLEANAMAQGFGNFFAYFLATIVAVVFTYDVFIEDFNKLKERKKFYAIFIPIAAVVGVGLAYLVDFLVGLGVEASNNQQIIVIIMKYGGAPFMIMSTIFFAPVIEELMYRKCVFFYFKKFGKPICYIVSILLFTMPHMISSFKSYSFGVWLLQSIPYLFSALMLSFVYDRSNENIYASIALHMLNNILAVLLVYVG